VRPSDGLISDDSKFAHKLLDAFVRIYEFDHDPHWKELRSSLLQEPYRKMP